MEAFRILGFIVLICLVIAGGAWLNLRYGG